MLRKSLKQALFWLNDALATLSFLLHRRRPKQGLTILCYHRLASGLPREIPHPAYNVSLERFRQHLSAFDQLSSVLPISSNELARWVESGPPSRGAFVLWTFDDGWKHILQAVDGLAKRKIPAALSVPTQYVGASFFPFSAFDVWCTQHPESSSGWYTPVDAHDCEQLRTHGVEILPHGHSHSSLGNLPRDQMEKDVAQSIEWICSTFGEPPLGFCYPYGSSWLGDFSDEVIEVLKSFGIRYALSTDAGVNQLNALSREAYRLRRIPVHEHDTPLFFMAKASGYCGMLPVLKAVLHSSSRFFRRVFGNGLATKYDRSTSGFSQDAGARRSLAPGSDEPSLSPCFSPGSRATVPRR